MISGKLLYCHKCDEYLSLDSFYADGRYKSGVFPICKKCLIKEACDYDKQTNSYVDNREKTKKVFQMMDLPFFDTLYKSVMNSAIE